MAKPPPPPPALSRLSSVEPREDVDTREDPRENVHRSRRGEGVKKQQPDERSHRGVPSPRTPPPFPPSRPKEPSREKRNLHRENLVGPFVAHNFWGPRPPPPSYASLPPAPNCRQTLEGLIAGVTGPLTFPLPLSLALSDPPKSAGVYKRVLFGGGNDVVRIQSSSP